MLDYKLASRLLFATAAVSALGFGLVSLAVARGKTLRFDKRAKRSVHRLRVDSAHPKTLRIAALGTTPLGKWWTYVPASLISARRLQRHGRTAAAVTVASSAAAAGLMSLLLDQTVSKRAPPPERHAPGKQSYPSGHALKSSAMALTTSYVLLREGLAPARDLPGVADVRGPSRAGVAGGRRRSPAARPTLDERRAGWLLRWRRVGRDLRRTV